MLDPGGNIQSAFEQANRHHDSAAGAAIELQSALQTAAKTTRAQMDAGENTLFEKYLTASPEKLRGDPDWHQSDDLSAIEGESLENVEASAGNAEPQHKPASDGFSWRNDRQLIWQGASKNDTLNFKCESNDTDSTAGDSADSPGETRTCDLFVNLTKGGDYGTVSISLNGDLLKEKLDLYSTDPTTTGRMSLGRVKLNSNEVAFEVTITGRNEQATAYMFGLDYVEFVPVSTASTGEHGLADIASRDGLDVGLLQRMVEAINSPQLAAASHPLRLLQQLSRVGA